MRNANNLSRKNNVSNPTRASIGSKGSNAAYQNVQSKVNSRRANDVVNSQSRRYIQGTGSPGLARGSSKGSLAGGIGPQAQPKLNLDHFTTAQKNINSAVLEYLLKNGMVRTVDTLQEELVGAKNQGMQKNMLFDENTGISHMLNAFDLGKREHFFISWNRFVPITLRASDLKC